MTPAFWRGKRVLVTGHTGFKGAWACVLLHRLGARPFGFALPPETPSAYAMGSVAELLEGERLGDLRDAALTRDTLERFAPDIVLHMAAQSLVRRAHREPVETFTSNIVGTVHLLDAVRATQSVQTVLVTTTDKVYHNAETGRPFVEGDRLGGHEPYGTSKAATELIIAAYRSSYFTGRKLPVHVARCGNVVGGGDWSADRIIPDIVRAAMRGAPLDVRHPEAVRPWLYVLDSLAGYLTLVERGGADQDAATDPDSYAWNFGPSDTADSVTVGELCRWATATWPQRFQWHVRPDTTGTRESHLLLLDPSRARSTLGWSPRYTAPEAVRRTFAWYEAVGSGASARAEMVREIDAYMSQPVPA